MNLFSQKKGVYVHAPLWSLALAQALSRGEIKTSTVDVG